MSKPQFNRMENVTRVFRLRWDSAIQMKKYFRIRKNKQFKKLASKVGLPEAIAQKERRLDTALWRSGLCRSIIEARLLLRNNHVTVNDVIVGNRPGRLLEVGDMATIHLLPLDSSAPTSTEDDEEDTSETEDTDEITDIESTNKGKVTPMSSQEILDKITAEANELSDEEKIIAQPPFHLDVHYPSRTFILSELPDTRLLEYPFKII